MQKVIIRERINIMNKLRSFPRPVGGCIHALRQGHPEEFLSFLKADILFYFYQLRKWWNA